MNRVIGAAAATLFALSVLAAATKRIHKLTDVDHALFALSLAAAAAALAFGPEDC